MVLYWVHFSKENILKQLMYWKTVLHLKCSTLNLSLLDAENIFQGPFPVRNETNVNSPTINYMQLAFLN